MKTKSLNAHEPFSIFIKTAFVVGLLLSSPWVFYQIWSFVAAGLYPHEQKFVHIFLPFSIGLFFAGASLAFYFVTYRLFHTNNDEGVLALHVQGLPVICISSVNG